MIEKHLKIEYKEYDDLTELESIHQQLLITAKAFTENAYAPYSGFKVAATALLSNGEIVSGTNQENASYPVGICAERTLFSTIANIYPNHKIEALAISYYNTAKDINDVPATPCGMCRQAIAEWIGRQGSGFTLLLAGQSGPIWVFENALAILPFSFGKTMLS